MMTTIRRADSKDCEAMFSLAKAFATSFVVERRAFDSSFAALLLAPNAFLAVAVRAEHVIGYLLGFDHHTLYANGRVAWVEEIMVREEMRRRGIGRQLMGSFEAWARERRAKLVGLATRRAAPFYRSMGYEESATYFRKLL
jgi:GNAT superfamily N-acetyltransferase